MMKEIEQIENWLHLYRNDTLRVNLSYTRMDKSVKYKLVLSPNYREMVLSKPLFRLLFASITGKPIDESHTNVSQSNGYQHPDWYLSHLLGFTRRLIIDELLEDMER